MQRLQHQVEAELRVFAEFADPLVIRQQQAAVEAALSHTEQLVRTAAQQAGFSVGWVTLPRAAVEDLIGFTADGSPLRRLLDALGAAAAASVRDALIQGVALGHNPTRIARQIRSALGGNLARALTISRTEVLRAYREATLRSYQANADVVETWIWNCACTERSCAMCWAMHGSEHPLTERLDDHPNGRCSMLPKVRPVTGMAPQTLPETGPAQFARLKPEQQDAILGKAAGAAYRAGAIRLEDVVGRSWDPDWGSMRRVKSLREMVGREEAGKWLFGRGKAGVKPLLPFGKKPSAVFDMSKLPGQKAALRRSVDQAFTAIEKVHGFPDNAPGIPIEPTSGKVRVGVYESTYGGSPIRIGVSRNGEHPELTLAHEIGHYLDQQLLDTPRRFASETSTRLDAWRDAVRNSTAIRQLQDVLTAGKIEIAPGNWMPADKKWLRYALTKREIFARSYAQYIAEVSGDQVMLEAIQRDREGFYSAKQWDTADFVPIRKAFDDLFAKLGWRQ